MNDSGMQLFVQLSNIVAGLVFLYCLFSIPAQVIRRFRLKRQGKPVSPIPLIIRKLLKYWLFTALILIPFSLVISYRAMSGGSLSDSELFAALFTQAFIGNVGTSLLFGYVFMKANKASWSHSVAQSSNENAFVKSNLQIVALVAGAAFLGVVFIPSMTSEELPAGDMAYAETVTPEEAEYCESFRTVGEEIMQARQHGMTYETYVNRALSNMDPSLHGMFRTFAEGAWDTPVDPANEDEHVYQYGEGMYRGCLERVSGQLD